jgi:hypothetical protein
MLRFQPNHPLRPTSRNRLASTIPVTIEFGFLPLYLVSKAQTWADAAEHQRFSQDLTARLSDLFRQLGLESKPVIRVQFVSSTRAIRIRIHDSLQPYSPDLVQRVWWTVMPADLHYLAQDIEADLLPGRPDVWSQALLFEPDTSTGGLSQKLIFKYLTELVVEAIRTSPACLLGPAQVEAFQQAGSGPPSGPELPLQPETLMPVLNSLLDAGVSIMNKTLIVRTAQEGRALADSTEDVAERVFARLHSSHIRIHIHPDYLATLIPGISTRQPLSVYAKEIPPDFQEPFRQLERELYDRLGVRWTDLIWMPSIRVGKRTITVQINDLLGPTLPGLNADELLVDAPADWLQVFGIELERQLINPFDGQEMSIIAETDNRNFNVWRPIEFVAMLLQNEISRLAYRLLSVEDVEYQLSRLDEPFPALTQTVLSQFSLSDITRVLRGLLRQDLSIRSLFPILEHLLRYDAILVGADACKNLLFDTRLPLPAGTPPELIRSWPHYLEFVKKRLANPYADKSLFNPYQDAAPALIELAPDLEAHLLQGGLDEIERELFCDSLRAELKNTTHLPEAPAILTTIEAKAAVQAAIRAELPHLSVLTYADLPPEPRPSVVAVIQKPKMIHHRFSCWLSGRSWTRFQSLLVTDSC